MADGDPLKIGNPNTGSSRTSLTTNVEDSALFVETQDLELTRLSKRNTIIRKQEGQQLQPKAM